MNKIPLHWRYAFITGIVVIAWMLFEYVMGWHATSAGANTSFIGVVLFLLGLFFAIRNTRDTVLKGVLDIKIGMLVGLQFALIVGVISALGTFMYYQFINTNYAEYWAQKSEEAMIAAKTAPALISQTKQNILATFTPIKQATQRLLFTILGGFFASMVLSLLLKKNPEKE